jgi:trans-aconitate 2-methyltransferase
VGGHILGSVSYNMRQPSELPVWDGSLYAANTGHHRVHDGWFLADLPLARTDRVLDLGCGSGDFTRTIADLVPDGHVVGLDPQPSLLAEARTRAGSNQSFVQGPVQRLATLVPESASFDVVMSRSAMHWVQYDDHVQLLRDASRLLRPGGWLRMELGGAGNIPTILAVLNPESAARGGPSTPWAFIDAGTYLEWLELAGFEPGTGHVRTVAQRRHFDETTLIGWLRSQCLQAYEAAMPVEHHAAFRHAVEGRLDDLRRHDGTFDQTFVRLDVLARKQCGHALRPTLGSRPQQGATVGNEQFLPPAREPLTRCGPPRLDARIG